MTNGIGARYAANSLASGLKNSFNVLASGQVMQFPRALIQPAVGGLSALSNIAIGVRNILDPSELEHSKEKYKNNQPFSDK